MNSIAAATDVHKLGHPIPDQRADAPALAAAMRAVFIGLATLIARGLLRHPDYAILILPLWTRLNRAATRFDRLMARIAAGTIQPGRSTATHRAGSHGASPPRFPAARAWLLAALRHEAAHFTQRIQNLLADPATARLVAATPRAQSLLRPICHMLGVRHPAVPPRARKRRPAAAKAEQGRGLSPPTETAFRPPAAPTAPRREPCDHHFLWPFRSSPPPPRPSPVHREYITLAEYNALAPTVPRSPLPAPPPWSPRKR